MLWPSVIFFVLLTLHIWIRYSREGRLISKIPGPYGLPIFGSMFIVANKTPEQMWNFLRRKVTEYFPIGKVLVGHLALVFIGDPNDIKTLLSCKTNINKGFMYKHFEIWLQKGSFTSSDEKWHYRRKLLTPAFHPNVLKMYQDLINKHAEKLISSMESISDKTDQSVSPLLSEFALNIICESTMGVNLNNLEAEEKQKYINAIVDITEIFSYRTMKPYLTDWMMKFLKLNKKMQRAQKELKSFSDKVIRERIKFHENTDYAFLQGIIQDDVIMTDSPANKRKGLCMLDLLLAAQRDGLIDEEGISEEVNTVIFGGYDTLKSTLMYIMMALAENKEAQNSARAEVKEVLSSCGGNLSTADLKKLDYTKRCIKESLRLFPSGPHFVRKLNKELQLQNYTVPSGSNVCIMAFDVHRRPEYWSNPEKFDPDRFLPENVQNRHPYAYIPFSAGIRNCTGQKFAMMEMMTMVAHVLSNFYLEPIEKISDLKFKFDAVLTTAHPTNVKLIKIKEE